MATLKDASLVSFPFQTVPLMEPTPVWIGRESFKRSITDLVESWSYRQDSTIYLLWADFGAGKTHAQRHLQYLASKATPPALAIYADLPKVADDFKGVYEQIIPQFPESVLRDAIFNFRAAAGSAWLSDPMLRGDRDTPRVLWALAQTPDHMAGDIARKWLRGEKCTAANLALLDNVSALTNSDQATRSLSTICRLIAGYTEYNRVVIMLDEFQRIGASTPKKLTAINVGIHTWFNSCPQGLSIILVYSIGVPETIKHLVTPEVQSRVTDMLTLPGLDAEEAEKFITGILAMHAVDGEADRVFSPAARARIIQEVIEESDGRVTPRALMLRFSANLQSAMQSDAMFPIES